LTAAALVSAKHWPTANREATRSLSPALDARQKGGAANRRLSRLHECGVRVRVNLEDRAPALSNSVTTTSLLTGAGFGRRTFSHSHRLAVLPRLSRQRVCCSLQHARAHSVRVVACKRSRAQSLAHKHSIDRLAYVPHLSSLSSACTVREVCCATKGFENARKAFGELRNV
jgi:hypothetical protein